MRFIIVVVVLVVVGIGVAGFSLGWFTFSSSTSEQKRDVTLSVDPEKIKKSRDAVTGLFHTSHAAYQTEVETQLKGMDKSLDELKVKAMKADGETKNQLNQTISDLGKKTQAVRDELKELASTAQDGYEAAKTRLSVSLAELKVGFDKAGTRFQ